MTAAVTAQDYAIKPVLITWTRDANTTFLVDLTTPKTAADFAAGQPALSIDAASFVSGGGYKGRLEFAGPLNFPSNNWTLEMVVRISSDATSTDPLLIANWGNSAQSFNYSLFLEKGFGVRQRLTWWNPTNNFFAQPFAGGNGRSIQASAVDKWVFIAYGMDFTNQQCLTTARELSGDVLNQDVQFCPTPWLDTGFLAGLTPSQQTVESARRWQEVRKVFSANIPATLSLGNQLIETRYIRISNRFRSELFQVLPELPTSSATVWTPSSIDSARAQLQTNNLAVGYSGYANYVTQPVTESFLPLTVVNSSVTLQLTNLPVGLYSMYVYGSVDPAGRSSLPGIWQPCPLEFEARRTSDNSLLNRGKMLLKQSFKPRRMQGFHFHVTEQGNVSATFRLAPSAMEVPRIQKIVLVDQLEGLPDAAVKTRQNLGSGSSAQLSTLTTQRTQRDDTIWNALPPLNTHLQVHGQVPAFSSPPAGSAVDPWVSKCIEGLQLWDQPSHTFDALDFVNTMTRETFPQNQILAGAPWPGSFGDDGTGVFFRKSLFPSLSSDIYNTTRAELLGFRYLLFAGAIMNSRGSLYGLQLPLNYSLYGDPNIGHDGALALVRLAYDWPALEMSLHEPRLCTHTPDLEYNVDWSSESVRNGKIFYKGWSGDHARWLFEAYDQVFPYINNNQVFASAVHRFIPWVNTPQDVVRMLDRYLVFSSLRDVDRGLINGDANIGDLAAEVLGPSPYTEALYDLSTQYVSMYPLEGPYQEMYGTALSRSGVYYIGSFQTYAFGAAQNTISKAFMMKKAKEAGVTLAMDLSNVEKFPKVRSAAQYLLDMWVGGGFPFMVGDASGGPHSGMESERRLSMASDAVTKAFELTSDPRLAWVLKNQLANNTPAVIAAATGGRNPVLYNTSRVVPDYGAIMELNPDETNLLKKTAATLRLGIGQGHAHDDYLDLNLFGMGLPLAVDLACRNEGDNWSRPHAGWSFLHNHALSHSTEDPSGAGAQTGEPWLRSFTPPLLRARYVDQTGSTQLDRDVLHMELGDTGNYYVFDVQRLSGGTYHTWAFHGCESETLDLNIPMQSQTLRWTDRTLEGTQKVATGATNRLQATWTMTRSTNSYPYTFNGGGVLSTVGCEPTSLGPLYNASLAPVKVRATLLGRDSDRIMQGNPYSAAYHYNFPFLWAQSSNHSESVYPAIYEWYRGTTPVIADAQILRTSPLQVLVTTTQGQQDTYDYTTDYCLSVSRDSSGVRWAKLTGATNVTLPDLNLAGMTNYSVTITDIDYAARRLTTSGKLPANAAVMAGNPGRRIHLQLKGNGTNYTWDDDLLIHEGKLTSVQISSSNSVALTSSQSVLFGDMGNRKSTSMTVCSEDGLWHFRGGQVIRKPAGVALTPSVFTDANGDGLVNIKTYEIGIGDSLEVPADVTLKRQGSNYLVLANTTVTGSIQGKGFNFTPSTAWQPVLAPPTNVRAVATATP